jgi:hypothetical protein
MGVAMVGTYSPGQEMPPGTARRSRWLIALLVVVVVCVVAAVAVVAVLVTRNDRHAAAPSATPTASVTAPSSVPSSVPSSAAQQSVTPSATAAPFELGYQPLFPFASLAAARAWEQSHRDGGHQPWHLDAGLTAQAFTTGYLGFTDLDVVTRNVTDSLGAHVGVGYRDPDGAVRTAAVLHLVRFGTEADAPWEVVGSDDTTFTLEVPAYGSVVASPVTAGGRISGVDENIVVAVRQLSSDKPLGESGGVPAGGERRPWTATVQFVQPSDTTLTIVASTVGHLQQVERFAVQGVRALRLPL